MRRFLFLCLLTLTVSAVAFAQQMTDEQVVQHVQKALQSGKSQQQILVELMQKGVTKEQLQRLQAKYSGGQQNENSAEENDKTRLRTSQQYVNKNNPQGSSNFDATNSKKQSIKGLRAKMKRQPADKEKDSENDSIKHIFGHNIFDNEYLTFEPNINIATPDNYRLGAGDEIIINVWGASQKTIKKTISPEGTVQIDNLGPVYLSGKSIKEADNYLKKEFSKIYAGVTGDTPNTEIKLTLGEVRSIQVNVMGEVVVPAPIRSLRSLPCSMRYIGRAVSMK